MNPTPQPVVDIKHITQRVIDYYYSYGNVQQLSTKSIPSIPDIVNMVPAFYREA